MCLGLAVVALVETHNLLGWEPQTPLKHLGAEEEVVEYLMVLSQLFQEHLTP
jgi:hypothetical protein